VKKQVFDLMNTQAIEFFFELRADSAKLAQGSHQI
jgi:hypothetical protein